MEKSLQFRLFQAALTEREHRLVFQTTPEKPEDEAKKLEALIADPNAKAEDLQSEILKFAGKSREHMKIADDRLQAALDKKTQPEKDLAAAKKLTSEDNPEWQKIIAGIKPKEGKVDAEVVKEAKKKIKESRDAIIALADDSSRPKNAIAQAEAYNKLIVDIQSLDPENTITFVEGVGGAEDDAVLETAKKQRNATFDPEGDFEKAVKTYTKAEGGTAASIEIARKNLETAAKDAKDTIWSLLSADLNGKKGVPYVNGEQITTVYLDLLKEVNKSVADAKAKVEPGSVKPVEAKGGAGIPAPVEAPKENPDDVIKELEIGKQVAAVEAAVTNGGDIEGMLAALNKKEKVQANAARVAAVLTTKFAEKGVKFKAEEKKVVLDTSVPAAPVEARPGAAVETKEKFDLAKLIKMIIDFLRGENIARLEERAEGGDINALRGLRNIKKKEIKAVESDKELQKPEKDQKVRELRKEINELELRIEEVEKKNNDFAAKARTETRGTPLQVKQEGGPGKGGTPFLTPAPGVKPAEAKPAMQSVLNGVQAEVPGGVRMETINGQKRIYVNGYMDVTITDKPTGGPDVRFEDNLNIQVEDAPAPLGPRPKFNRGRRNRREKVDGLNEGSKPAPSATDMKDIPPSPAEPFGEEVPVEPVPPLERLPIPPPPTPSEPLDRSFPPT